MSKQYKQTNRVKMNYIYILKLSNNKHYTGITENINRRLKEHITGKSKSTRHNLPIHLIFLTTMYNRPIARELEVYIKNKGAKRFMIQNEFDNRYDNIALYPDMIKYLIEFDYKQVEINNQKRIIFN